MPARRCPPRSADRVRCADRIDRLLPVDGRKRHIVTDTNGFPVGAMVHGADLQDRDGAVPLLASIRDTFPWLRRVFADGADAGKKLETALAALGQWSLELVKRPPAVVGFAVLSRPPAGPPGPARSAAGAFACWRGWVVERTFAWLGRNRRLAKDF
jgi:putative transposase